MNRRSMGVVFICIAAFLYSVRYICAAIWVSGTNGWGWPHFKEALHNLGSGLLLFSIISLIIGVIYLAISEFENNLKNTFKEIKKNWNDYDTTP